MVDKPKRPRVFVSHSSKDKPFVRVLVGELQDRGVRVWFDERELGIGDSIVSNISSGLADSDYVLLVLSKASVQSKWVHAEMNAALVRQFSEGGVILLPVLLEDCEVPALLKDRIYADFRVSADRGDKSNIFERALRKLVEVLGLEDEIVRYSAKNGPLGLVPAAREDCHYEAPRQCVTVLQQYSAADIRRIIHSKLALDEIRAVWFDTFETDMLDDSRDKTKLDRSIDLLLMAKREEKMKDLIRELCKNYHRKLPCTNEPQ